jgi:hypothetical protein
VKLENVLEVTPEKLKELLDSGAIVIEGEGGTMESEEEEEDLSPSQVLEIPGIGEVDVSGAKVSVMTPGTALTGTIVLEIEPKPGFNSFLFDWMSKARTLDLVLRTSDCDGNLIDTWEFSAIPEAVSFGETGGKEKDPWLTTTQLTFRDLKIT